MKICGKFIGETSCGFVSGWVYEIRISTDNANKFVWVKDIHGEGVCPYSSINALAKNWEIPTEEPFIKQKRIAEYPVGNNWQKPQQI